MIGALVAVELIVVMIGTAVPTSRLSAKLVVVDELHQNVSCHYYTYVYMHIMSYHVITCHVMSCHIMCPSSVFPTYRQSTLLQACMYTVMKMMVEFFPPCFSGKSDKRSGLCLPLCK